MVLLIYWVPEAWNNGMHQEDLCLSLLPVIVPGRKMLGDAGRWLEVFFHVETLKMLD